MVHQTGPAPWGSYTTMVVHGSTFRSIVPISHQVAQLAPQPHARKFIPDDLKVENLGFNHNSQFRFVSAGMGGIFCSGPSAETEWG